MQRVGIKICKVRDPENIASLCRLEPDYLGFDFRASSPYYIGEIDEALLSVIPGGVSKIGVFSNEDPLYITYIAGRFSLSGVQIEGDVAPRTLEVLVGEGLEVIKVVNHSTDIQNYEGVCNKFLIRDAKLLEHYNSATPIIVDSKIWNGSGVVVDMGEEFDKSVALKNIEKIENWRKNNIER